jgi:DNA-directed RNA polymerase subunit M/transcription elongation factor TFIIS
MATKCACCGGDMLPEKDIGNSVIYKCAECGLSDTRLRVEAEEKRVDIGSEESHHQIG